MLMTSKLTLSIDAETIKKAKEFLLDDKESLSGLVERYFKLLLFTKTNKQANTPTAKELVGFVKNASNKNDNDIIYEYLKEKYK